MKCTRCGEWVALLKDVCPKCGCDLSLLQSLQKIADAVRLAQANSDAVVTRLNELEQLASSLEPKIVTALAPPPALPIEKQSQINEPTQPKTYEVPSMDKVKADNDMPEQTQESWAQKGSRMTVEQPLTLTSETEVRFGQKWMLIIGLALTVLAVGYFLKYSFDRNWIGPVGRVSLAYFAGLSLLGVGEFFRRRKLDIFGLYLLGGGIAVLYFANYAAFQIYDLIGHLPAFGLMILVTAFAGFASLRYDTKWLAVLGIIGGFATPIVLTTGTDNQVALMVYMAILNGGILAIAAFKQWRLLNHLGFMFTWILFSVWFVKYYADPKFWTTTVFLNLFFLTYAVVPFAYYFIKKDKTQMAGFAICIPNTFIAFIYSSLTIRSHFSLECVGVATIAYAAVFLGMAAFLRRRNPDNQEAFTVLLAKGILFLIITVPIVFSENWLTLFWAIQAVVMLWVALRLSNDWLQGGAILLLIVAIGKLVFFDYLAVFELNPLDVCYRCGFATDMLGRWMTIIFTIGSVFWSARLFKRAGLDRGHWEVNLAVKCLGSFVVLTFLALNIEVCAFFYDYLPRARLASISVLWALFATGLMIFGFTRNRSFVRRCSIALFAATIVKVFIRDMANVETPYRILSLLVLGIMLVGASYLYHRFKDRILPPPDEAMESSDAVGEPQPPVAL